MTSDQYLERSAVISDCGRYRYRLWRKWAHSDRMPVLWIMLNPSTADGTEDDPTIRRCREFSKAWGYGSMWIGNLYAYRSTDPSVLKTLGAEDARGPANDQHLYEMSCESAIIVCGWGNPGGEYMRTRLPLTVLSPGGIWCLGKTKHRAPRHPLYLPSASKLEKVA